MSPILFGTKVALMPRTCSGVLHGRFYARPCPSDAMPRTCSGVLHALGGGETSVNYPGASPGHPNRKRAEHDWNVPFIPAERLVADLHFRFLGSTGNTFSTSSP